MFQVVDHYENPRNVGSLDKTSKNVGTGLVGAPACGDVMKLQVLAGCKGTSFAHRTFCFICPVRWDEWLSWMMRVETCLVLKEITSFSSSASA